MFCFKRLLASSSSQCQLPLDKSTLLNTFAFASSGNTSSIVGSGYVSRCSTSLRGLGSMQMGSLPLFFICTEI